MKSERHIKRQVGAQLTGLRNRGRVKLRLKFVVTDEMFALEQDRHVFDGIEDLAASISATGCCEPPVVTPADPKTAPPGKRWRLVSGERRYRAQKLNGARRMLVIVADLTDEEILSWQWAENQARRSLTPIEEARAIQRRQRLYGWDVATASRNLEMAESTIRDRLSLLRCIDEAQQMLERNQIPASYALVLAKMSPAAQHAAVPLLADSLCHARFRSDCAEIQKRYDQMALPGYDAFSEAYQAGIDEWVAGQQQRLQPKPEGEEAVYPALQGLPEVPRAQTQSVSLALYIEMLAASDDPQLIEYSKVLGHLYNEWRRAGRIRHRPN